MKKYKHISLIILITIILSIISNTGLGLTFGIIVYTIGFTAIILLAKRTNTYENKLIDNISKAIYKILNITTILIIIATIGINIIQQDSITTTYNELSDSNTFSISTVATKSVCIDIISTKDVFKYIGGEKKTKETLRETYEKLPIKTVFSEVNNIEKNTKKLNIIEIIKSSYWLMKHYKKTRDICILTLLAYISIIYRLRTKNRTK